MRHFGSPLWERHVNGHHKPALAALEPGSVYAPELRPPPVSLPSRQRVPVGSAGPTPRHIVLLCTTVLTTLLAGMNWEGIASPLEHLGQFYRGIPYAVTLLGILFCHEMGHYLTARYYGMEVTWPFFIPGPPFLMGIPFLGTFGAVIRMKSPPQHRRALLYVGAAGPIAGFCVALLAIMYAYAMATVAPTPPGASSFYFTVVSTLPDGSNFYFHEPLLLRLVSLCILGPLPEGMTVSINSVGVAAWFGLLVTVLNLLPIGQLDGGHIVYALLGRRARYVSWLAIVGLLVLGVGWWSGWILWAFLGWLSGRRQPVVLDQYDPLNRHSHLIAGIALAIFVLCFVPVPISL